jgi:hypothetical protein
MNKDIDMKNRHIIALSAIIKRVIVLCVLLAGIVPATASDVPRERELKRRFLSIGVIAGYSYKGKSMNSFLYPGDIERHDLHGLHLGLDFGYLFAVHPYLAIGGGMTFQAPVLGALKISNVRTGEALYQRFESLDLLGSTIGSTLDLRLLIGDLAGNLPIFTLDIGGGLLFRIMAGVTWRGFTLKGGYHLTIDLNSIMAGTKSVPLFMHHVTFSIGVMLNWNGSAPRRKVNRNGT